MKIVWVTNSPTTPTGFGQQSKLMIEELQSRGHECVVICRPHTNATDICEEVHTEQYRWEYVDQQISRIQPDVVICFEGHKLLLNLMGMRITPANCPVYFWYPFEGLAVPDYMEEPFKGVPSHQIVHLSNFAADLWQGQTVIPHTHHPSYKKLDVDKVQLRKKWARKLQQPLLESTLLLFNINRNFFHKGWDDLFGILKQVRDAGIDAQLLCHTKKTFNESQGGFDLPKLARLYGVEENILFSENTLTPDELNELYNMADVQVDPTHGEGCGLTILEAKAAGTPQILSNHTTMPEIAADDIRIEPASITYRMGTLWAQPDANAMAEAIINKEYEYIPEGVDPRFDLLTIVDQWEQLLSSTYEGWSDHRYGYKAKVGVSAANIAAAKTCQIFKWSAYQVGVYDVDFLEWAMKFNVKCSGIDIVDNIGDISEGVSQIVNIAEYDSLWNSVRDCLVLTNMQDILCGDPDPQKIDTMMAKITEFDNILLLTEPCYKWGSGRINPDQFRQYLINAGMKRHRALEHKTRSKVPAFTHEIWSKLDLQVPESLNK